DEERAAGGKEHDVLKESGLVQHVPRPDESARGIKLGPIMKRCLKRDQHRAGDVKRYCADARPADKLVTGRKPGTKVKEQRRQQSKSRQVKEVHQLVQDGKLLSAAVKVDDEGRQKPGQKVIGELGLALPEEHVQTDSKIYKPYNRQVQSKLTLG